MTLKRLKPHLYLLLLLLLFVFSSCMSFFQRPDKKFSYTVSNPVYPGKNGPSVYIDQAHFNEHNLNTGYKPFGSVLKSDGYNLFSFKEKFDKESLEDVDILVIVNALNEINYKNLALPTYPAFTKEEIIAIKNWVTNGGSLFLIADHMPYPGAASDLATEFGFSFYNSFVMLSKYKGKIVFTTADKTLNSFTPITNNLDSIVSYFGSAFKFPKEATNILSIPEEYTIYLPRKPWFFPKSTPTYSSEKTSQGAVMEFGKGKVAIFAEGAMFTAQYMAFNKSGMNAPEAKHNTQFLLNLVHWLDKSQNNK